MLSMLCDISLSLSLSIVYNIFFSVSLIFVGKVSIHSKAKILLEGYPRLRSRTYPLVHDQAFALGQEVSKVLVLNSSSSKRDKIYESEMLPAVDFYESRTDVLVSKISGDENSSVVDQLSKGFST